MIFYFYIAPQTNLIAKHAKLKAEHCKQTREKKHFFIRITPKIKNSKRFFFVNLAVVIRHRRPIINVMTRLTTTALVLLAKTRAHRRRTWKSLRARRNRRPKPAHRCHATTMIHIKIPPLRSLLATSLPSVIIFYCCLKQRTYFAFFFLQL